MIAFGMPGGSEWLVILLIVLIFFGAGRLPDVMSQFGKGLRAFKDASKTGEDDEDEPVTRKAKAKAQLSEVDDLDDEGKTAGKSKAASKKSEE